ncbi:hypothetical protein J5J10_11820 [Ciceribacter sp. L1K23]|uniref:DUF6107 family protein n=1 Tax=unclassified Ciceribacter TaxID=2628820 RepID=UPI001ABE1284|nr:MULTISPECIES: DUF6107 family protein [unclassified Ciceribacter]MBO3759475.1 hypothetical protein [Ciceribacter sp. L1K22]MBR0556366.1 hypothetical protein [Ciceribacter sp. L1K23]
MADFTPDGGLWTARLIGAVSGAAISLAYFLPKDRQEAAVRFLTGVATGIIFGGPTGLWIAARLEVAATLSAVEIMLMGSASASLCAWWGLGVLARIAGRWGGGKGAGA